MTNDTRQIGNNRARCFLDELANPYGIKHIDNKPRVSSMPYTYDIAEGKVPQHAPVRRPGYNTDVDTGSNEVVAPCGGAYYWLPAAEQLLVASTDADDTAAGNGARTVSIRGLDADYEIITETVTMNGTTNVQTTNEFLRVLMVRTATAGDTAANEGVITVNDATDTYVLSCIQVGENRAAYALYTVPANNTLYITSWGGSESSSKGTDFTLWKRDFGGYFERYRGENVIDASFTKGFDLPLEFGEKTDIEIRAIAVSNDAVVEAGFEGWREW